MTDHRARVDRQVARFEAGRDSAEPEFLRRLRAGAIESFARLGFPARTDEAWRSTPMDRLAAIPFGSMDGAGNGLTPDRVDVMAPGLPAAVRLVFVNGGYRPDLSVLDAVPGLRAGSLAEAASAEPANLEPHLGRYADGADHPFVALNTALWRDGAFVRVDDGVALAAPVHIVHVVSEPGKAAAVDPRNLVIVGEGSELTVVESYVGPKSAAYWTNPVTEIVGGPGSVVDHYKVQREGEAAFHVSSVQAQVDRDGRFSSHSISLGGGLVRNDVRVVLGAEGGDCTLNGLYLLHGSQHEDNHTHIDHARPHCSSRENYKGVLDGESRGVFHGTVLVRKDAQKTDARQSNRNLLLSDEALVDTKPQLEIFADDVKCSHGATVGQLDADALFYLRTRGVDPENARRLLIHAFAAEILDDIPIPPLRAALEDDVLARLPRFSAEVAE